MLYTKHNFWSAVLQLRSLRCIVLGLGDVDALTALAEANPELRQFGDRQLQYYRHVTYEETQSGDWEWVGRDPESLDPTGMLIHQCTHTMRH